jgi:hypothetical protein
MTLIKSAFLYLLFNAIPFTFASPTYLGPRQDGAGATGGVVGSIPVNSSDDAGADAFQNAQCTNPAITDAATDPTTRWNSVGADIAWDAAVLSWINRPASNTLTFSQQISNFFHGPDNWICTDLGNTPCEGSVQCNDVNYPAG